MAIRWKNFKIVGWGTYLLVELYRIWPLYSLYLFRNAVLNWVCRNGLNDCKFYSIVRKFEPGHL